MARELGKMVFREVPTEVTGTITGITNTVTVGGTVAVSGTVPVSGTVAISTNPVPVSGSVTVSGTATVTNLNALVNIHHDQKVFGWTAGNLTSITYKHGGVTVATVTLTWVAGNLTDMMVT